MQCFSDIAANLRGETSEKFRFNWKSDMDLPFDYLKKDPTRSPVLAFPNLVLTFIVHTDDSSKAVGAVIARKGNDGRIHPIHFASRKTSDAEKTTLDARERISR